MQQAIPPPHIKYDDDSADGNAGLTGRKKEKGVAMIRGNISQKKPPPKKKKVATFHLFSFGSAREESFSLSAAPSSVDDGWAGVKADIYHS